MFPWSFLYYVRYLRSANSLVTLQHDYAKQDTFIIDAFTKQSLCQTRYSKVGTALSSTDNTFTLIYQKALCVKDEKSEWSGIYASCTTLLERKAPNVEIISINVKLRPFTYTYMYSGYLYMLAFICISLDIAMFQTESMLSLAFGGKDRFSTRRIFLMESGHFSGLRLLRLLMFQLQ